MGLFSREKEKPRSFEEITTPKDEMQEEMINSDCENEEENGKRLGEKVPNGVPFNPSEFTALSCFGWKEDKTEKWLAKCAKVWFLIISFAWFLFGAVTFAPIIFISNKIDVLFNDRKKSLMCGIIIYAVVVALIILLFATRQGNPPTPIA